MERLRGIEAIHQRFRKPVLTIGNFDGVHLGHQKIVALALEKAKERQGTCIAFTFKPHPQMALRPEGALSLLTTYEEKLDLLAKHGVQVAIEQPFSRHFSSVSPDHFFSDVILKSIGAEAIVVGYDFGFGKERQGDMETLETLCKSAGVELTVVPPLKVDGEIVSSSKIRQYLLSGDIEAGNRLLGHEFAYRGTVMKGEGRGRKLGFPTANLKLEEKLVLPYGVYATIAVLEKEGRIQTIPSVTNIGVRPTFYTPGPDESGRELPALVETHLLDTQLDLYGTSLEVRFVRRLREERKFDGVEKLKAQILLDAQQARALLASA